MRVCNAGGSDGVWSRVRVSYANLLLTSSFAPTASDFRGSLLSPQAHGTASLSFATEVAGGPGIYKVTATIDGKAVYDATPNTNGGRCAPVSTDGTTGALVFGYQQPCLHAQTVDLRVRTTTLRDGAHELAVVVTDAAQNSQTVLRQAITVNNRTTASSTLTSDPPEARRRPRTPAATDPVYALALDARTQALRSGSEDRVGALGAHAVGHRAFERGRSGGRDRRRAVRPAARLMVRRASWLEATSDEAGGWTLRAPRGPSRTLTIASGARPDPASAEAIRIRQAVRPRISLRVEALGRGRLRFSGRMRFEPLGSPRPLVRIQTLNTSRRWKGVGSSVRVSRLGRVLGDPRRRAEGDRVQLRVPDSRSRDRTVRDRHLQDPTGGGALMRSRTRLAHAVTVSIITCVGLLLTLSSVAAAASPPVTRQAAAANAAFLAYAPPPAGGARALCLVDTGVDVTPDTAPGLVSATALDGGTGSDVDPLKHGTIDAAVAGGAGHGVLGAWPQLKIVSVRATDNPEPGQLADLPVRRLHASRSRSARRVAADPRDRCNRHPAVVDHPADADQVDEFTAATAQRTRRGSRSSPPRATSPGQFSCQAASPGFCPSAPVDTVGGGICPFSAIDRPDVLRARLHCRPGRRRRQMPFCCGNGTSQASAFAAGVLGRAAQLRADADG